MKKYLLLILLTLSLLLVGCGAAEEATTWKIGGMGPLTGGAAVYGTAVRNGAELAINEINAAGGLNGIKFKFDMKDDKATAADASTGYDALYEAGMVDGATARQMFFKITVPLLKPILQFTMVTSAIGGLQMYDIPQLFNKGNPVLNIGGANVQSTRTIVMLIKSYIDAGAGQNYGRAAAYSVVLFIITLIVSMVFYKLTAEKN